MNMKKIVASASALALTAAVAVGGTLAYLTQEKTITNTFTYSADHSNITLTLQEHKYNPKAANDKDGFYGNITGELTDTGNNNYYVVPDAKVDKDPVVSLTSANDCYVFVKVDNQLGNKIDTADLVNQITVTNTWTALKGEDGVYYKENINTGNGSSLPVFSSITFKDAATIGAMAEPANIVVTAYAVTAVDFDTPAEAWAVFDK